MFSQTMRTAVLQATALFTISTLLSHHMSESAFSQIAENEGWINMTTALNKSSPHNIPYGRGLLTLDAGAEAIMIRNNATTKNGTFDADKAHSESYHLQVLPRQVVTFLIMSVLQYWWYIALEKMLPARPSRYTSTEKPQLQEKLSEDSEDREEEVVKRWIAQGRVRRASLNWCNTFLKWILDMTVGRLCYYAVEISIAMLISKLQSAPDGALRGPKNYITFAMVSTYLSIAPLAHLIVLIVAPAHRRIVVLAGVDLVQTFFVNTLFRVVAVWVVKTDYVQELMRNVTEKPIDLKFHGDEL